MSVPVVQTHQLVKVFKDFWLRPKAKAINGVSFTIGQGEVFGLLGPNGSGKSTTIKILLGLLFPTSGHASVFGRSPTDVDVKRRIGFLPEESYLYPYLNAREILDFYARLFGLDAQERGKRVKALIDMTGLSGAADRFVGEYSKGMARRIGIAQALINDPDFVILDEPTTGLDPIGTREIKDLILTLKAKGKTVLLSSHLLADVEDVCDRVAILYGGQVQAEGDTQGILQESNRLQITANMDAKTAAEAADLIRRHAGESADISITPPVQRLERVFLRVVEDARRREVATSGVSAARTELTFLTSVEKPVDVLDRLVNPDQTPPAKASEPEPVPRSEAAPRSEDSDVRRRLLDGLVLPKTTPRADAPEEEAVEKPKTGQPAPADRVDGDVLRRLTDRE